MKIIVPLAEGLEEIEAVSIIDVLRRANLDVTTAYLQKNPVKGSHNILITADKPLESLKPADFNCIVLPGGMPGSEHLKNNDTVNTFVKHIYSKGGYVGAICAAPIVLGHAGILYDRRATCFPGNEAQLEGAIIVDEPVVVDGTVITGKGPGCAIPFGLELVKILAGEEISNGLKNAMQVYWM
ncbi:MAG: DJ-1 family glyoxalase III [Spirochaetota bacterium]